MSVKDILVHINETIHCSKRVDFAIDLAKQHGATLIALYAQADPKVPMYAERETNTIGVSPNIDARRDIYISDNDKAKEMYETRAKEAGVEMIWHRGKFTSSRELVTDQMLQHAQQVDMVIVGQHDAKRCKGRTPKDLPERLVLESGRPILVLPYSGDHKPDFSTIIVAWNNGKQSVRAVNDALPLMTSAKKVKVFEINPTTNKKLLFTAGSTQLAEHLKRHGIPAIADHTITENIREADLLLNYASDNSAKLLVMGAYGHNRFRELILGGVTQHIFDHMTVPVLMSH